MTDEKLYIIIDGERKRLDLNSPSGITLSYESNLFNTLDKVNCSRSYTFNLPKTKNNINILGMPEDIRSIGAKVGDKFKAEFLVNGIDLTPNADIYISEYRGSYSAVMTWGVVEGLKELQKGKLNISELESREEAESLDNILIDEPYYFGFDYEENYYKPMRPFYEAGVPRETAIYPKVGLIVAAYKAYPLPVISVLMLLKRINERFGTKILQKEDGKYITDKVIQKGVVPDVKVQLTPSQYKLLTSTFSMPSCNERGILSFASVIDHSRNQYKIEDLTFGTVKPSVYTHITFIIEGNLKVNPSYVETAEKKPIYLCVSRGIPGSPTISNEWENDRRIESEYDTIEGEKVYRYEWNMNEALGTAIEVNYSYSDFMKAINFHFEDEDGNTCPSVTFSLATPLSQFLMFTPRWEEGSAPHLMDTIYSLPDISCFEFVKSLFYMIGAFPVTGENGNVIPAYYSDILDNLKERKVYDWSSKVINDGDNPKSIEWKVGDFAQRNLYRMKSDDETRGLGEDRYADGESVVVVDNNLLDSENTVVTLPFYAPFLSHGKRPGLNTGQTMKYWSLDEEGLLTAEQANPIFGIVTVTDMEDGTYYQEMRCFNFPNDVDLDPLRRMVQNPRVIKIELNLDEYSLKNLNYTTPVYLKQYSSYFAIITIQRSSNGISTAELIKIEL